MKKFALCLGILSLAASAFAAEKSDLLAPGSGHYAQVVCPNTDIKGISFGTRKVSLVNSVGPDCGANLIYTHDPADGLHIKGRPATASCVVKLLIDDTQPIDIEIYTINPPPAEAEWPALLAADWLKIPSYGYYKVLISSKVQNETPNPFPIPDPKAIVKDLYAGKYEPGSDTYTTLKTKMESSSCTFQEDFNTHVVRLTLIPNKVGVAPDTSIIHNCSLVYAFTYIPVGGNEYLPPEEVTPVSYFILKSYL